MNPEVSQFLDNLNHPFREEIEQLRRIILKARPDIEENIKWNGPNYHLKGQDRISIKVNPPKSFHLVLHSGAKVQPEPKSRLLAQDHGVLTWKSNDRAVADFKTTESFIKHKPYLDEIVRGWFAATL